MDKMKSFSACRLIVVCCVLTFFSLLSLRSEAQQIDQLPIYKLWNLGEVRLRQELIKPHADSVKFKILIALAQRLDNKAGSLKKDLDSAFYDLRLAGILSRKMKVQQWDIELYQNLAALTFSAGDFEKGKSYYMKVIKAYQASGDRLNEANGWFELASKYDWSHSAERLIYFNNALHIFRSLHQVELEAKTIKEIADTHFNHDQVDLAEKELLQVLSLYRSTHYKNLHYTYDLLSAVSRRKGDVNKTLSYSHAAVQSAKSTGDTANAICIFYWRLGDAYSDVGNLPKSIEYYKKAYQNAMLWGGGILYHVINDLTAQLIRTGDLKMAIHIVNSAYQYRPPIDLAEQKSLAFSAGDCYMALKNYSLAGKYYTKYAQQIGGGDDFQVFWMKLCRYYTLEKNFPQANIYMNKLISFGNTEGLPSRRKDIFLLKFQLDSASGNLIPAIHALQQYNRMKDSIFTAEKMKTVEELQMKFNTTEKEKDILRLKTQAALQDKKLQNENLTKNIVIGSCGVLVLFLLLLFNRYQIKNNANSELKKQQELVVDKNHMLELTIGEKTKLVHEKEFLLKEIHHRVKNNLQLTMSLLNSQCYYLTSEDAVKAIRESEHRLKSIALVHQKLYLGDHIDRMDLKTYILEVVSYLKESFTGSRNVHFETRIEEVDIDISQAVSVGLFVNEAITNIFKYAFADGQAGLVQVLIRRVEGSKFEALIKDNGRGLPEGFNIDQQKSLGFILMKGLSKQLGGNLIVYSDKGTNIGMNFTIHPLLGS